MDRKHFFDAVRSSIFGGSLSTPQVKGMEALFDAAQGLATEETAYILATAYHETATTMEPIAEYGKGKGRKYGVPGRNGGQVPYGRGFVQTTWDANYERTDRELGLGGRLIANYNLLLTDTAMAAKAAVRGMVEGWYTGKKLSDYFAGGKCDFVNARRIINGNDKAEIIAGHARIFLRAIQS
ncbi:hypothetical protein [Rhizobium favelukesii]|uniref:hypothetical protein n=1 Tax=Rhizobium favelukesii TaxID=348824 RepID=UPI00215F6AA2|nr:hypothetical protein [Rhizobium favelukesii]MCS0459548.1 hypothetical protein [Rhizobium favelukesii]